MKELTLAATLENIPKALTFIEEELANRDCGMKQQIYINVVFDELFCNVAKYAYPDKPGNVTLLFDFDESSRMASITFIDSGIPFDPLKKPDPDITLSLGQRKIGGLGIYMTKNLMDNVEYQRKDDKNILTIYKII